jgi:predicted transcriptional regulator
MKCTTIWLQEATCQRLKKIAAKEGRDVGCLLEKAVEEFVARKEKEAEQKSPAKGTETLTKPS